MISYLALCHWTARLSTPREHQKRPGKGRSLSSIVIPMVRQWNRKKPANGAHSFSVPEPSCEILYTRTLDIYRSLGLKPPSDAASRGYEGGRRYRLGCVESLNRTWRSTPTTTVRFSRSPRCRRRRTGLLRADGRFLFVEPIDDAAMSERVQLRFLQGSRTRVGYQYFGLLNPQRR